MSQPRAIPDVKTQNLNNCCMQTVYNWYSSHPDYKERDGDVLACPHCPKSFMLFDKDHWRFTTIANNAPLNVNLTKAANQA